MKTKGLLLLVMVLPFITINVQASQAPMADAGPDKYVSFGDDVVLSGAGSGDTPLNYEWTQVSGRRPLLTGVDTPNLSFAAPERVESLTFQLTVTDEDASAATDEVIVTVFEDSGNAVFVSSTLGHDDWLAHLEDPSVLELLDRVGLGSMQFPVQSLEKAVELAVAREPHADIYVQEGEYSATAPGTGEPLLIEDGVSMYGGFEVVPAPPILPGATDTRPVSGQWNRFIPSVPIYFSAPITFEHETTYYGRSTAMAIRNVNTPTTIDGLIIRSQPGRDRAGRGGAGENSIGIYIYNCNDNLTITNNQIHAGKGGSGKDGIPGSPGDPGTDGQDGEDGFSGFLLGSPVVKYGGQGGQSSCWVLAGQGGKGGHCYSTSITNPNAAIKLGAAGPDWRYGGHDPQMGYTSGEQGGYRSPLGGGGGHGGWWWRTVFGCWHKFRPADTGGLGRAGEHATGGAVGGKRKGSIVDHKWVGGRGGYGQDADPKAGQGRGGGGGGAGWPYVCGGRLRQEPRIPPQFLAGGGGGGGGGGGCPGEGGTGGTPGGGSFGVFLSCSSPHIRFNRISTVGGGDGGTGGRGGNGGTGGKPGQGGSGGYGFCEGIPEFGEVFGPTDYVRSGAGERGSHGGLGGSGASGGSGSGGASCGIFWKEYSELHVAFNTYDIGPAGTGGTEVPGSAYAEQVIRYLTMYGQWLASHGEKYGHIFRRKWEERDGEELPEVQKRRLENLKALRGKPGEDGLHNKFCPPVGPGTDPNFPRWFTVVQNTVAHFEWLVPGDMSGFYAFMAFGGSDIVLSLVSPSGRVIDRSTTAPDVAHAKGPTFESYTVSSPEEGDWTIRLFGADVPPEGEEAFVSVLLIPTNVPPVADAGADQALECTGGAGTQVTLDGSGSSDGGCCGALAFEWKDSGGQVVGTTAQASLMLPVGVHTFTLSVDDGRGGVDADSVTITVEDTLAPVISLNEDQRIVLMVGRDTYAEPGASANDMCDGDVPVTVGGDQVDDTTPGTYVVTYEAVDSCGNAAQATRIVDVIKVEVPEESLESLDHLVTMTVNHAGQDPQKDLYVVEVTAVNTSQHPIVGPILLAVDTISDAPVTLANYDATTPEGNKIVVLSKDPDDPIFEPGQGVTKQLYFDNEEQTTFTLALSVYGTAWYDDYNMLQQLCAEPTLGDLTGDCRADLADFAIFASIWHRGGLADIEHMPVAYWKLDETEGDFAPDSVASHDGALHSDPTWQPDAGMAAGALLFDGVNDYISTPFVLDPADGALSVFACVKGGKPGQAIISQANASTWLGTDPSHGWLVTEFRGPGWGSIQLKSQTPITDGQWHHVGFVWDPPDRVLYVDGLLVAADTQADALASVAGLYIGAGSSLQTGSYWTGMIDDVRIYDHRVVPEDVLQLPEPIKSDYDGNGTIDATDLRVLSSEWLDCYRPLQESCSEQ
jgi:hypothetical protein